MNRDISALLEAAIGRAWSETDASALLASLPVDYPGIAVDWDKGAGEYWARCIDAGHVVAFVGIKWPIMILLTICGVPSTWGKSVEVLLVDDMDARTLRAGPETLARFAVRRPQSNAFNPEAFSAEDLVWLSV